MKYGDDVYLEEVESAREYSSNSLDNTYYTEMALIVSYKKIQELEFQLAEKNVALVTAIETLNYGARFEDHHYAPLRALGQQCKDTLSNQTIAHHQKLMEAKDRVIESAKECMQVPCMGIFSLLKTTLANLEKLTASSTVQSDTKPKSD